MKNMGISRPNGIATLTEIEISETPKKTRYSDDELQEFKVILLELREKAYKLFLSFKKSLNHNDGNDDQDTSPTFKSSEEGDVALSKEENSQGALRQINIINDIDKALVRIEFKVYGICIQTGRLISKDRLKACPTAMLSVKAQEEQGEKKNCYTR